MKTLTFEKVWRDLNNILQDGDVIYTLDRKRRNKIDKITPEGFWVITDRSFPESELVPKEMFQKAVEHLIAERVLRNDKLLNDLNVKRSSFVLVTLAELPYVGFDLRPLRIFLKER